MSGIWIPTVLALYIRIILKSRKHRNIFFNFFLQLQISFQKRQKVNFNFDEKEIASFNLPRKKRLESWLGKLVNEKVQIFKTGLDQFQGLCML